MAELCSTQRAQNKGRTQAKLLETINQIESWMRILKGLLLKKQDRGQKETVASLREMIVEIISGSASIQYKTKKPFTLSV